MREVKEKKRRVSRHPSRTIWMMMFLLGLLESIEEKQQRAQKEKEIICPQCQHEMYLLEESISTCYVCHSCGFTVDKQGNEEPVRCSTEKPPIYKLFNHVFMEKYTNFDSFQDFLVNCPIDVEKIDLSSCDKIPFKYARKWDRYIKTQTVFQTWDEMFEKAIELHLHV